MKEICPYCNGLYPPEVVCPSCGGGLDDRGTLQEALGPYAPYEENSLVHSQFGCVHRLYCPDCDVEYSYTALPASSYLPPRDNRVEYGDDHQG